MNCTIVGKNIEITDGMRNYAEEKLSRLDRFSEDVDPSGHIRVLARIYPNGQKVEISVPVKHGSVRAEVTSDDFYESVDLAIDKLEDQIRRRKTKKLKRRKHDRRKGAYEENDDYDDWN